MKPLSIPTLSLNLTPAGSQSRIGHPLLQFLALVILIASVATHFYALGARSEADSLAYDESSSWTTITQSGLVANADSATDVLFSLQNNGLTAAVDAAGLDTIQSITSSMETASNPVPSTLPVRSGPDHLGATLIALNYGY